MADKNTLWGHWFLGSITQTILRMNDVIKTAAVKPSSREYRKPLVKLCLMETEHVTSNLCSSVRDAVKYQNILVEIILCLLLKDVINDGRN